MDLKKKIKAKVEGAKHYNEMVKPYHLVNAMVAGVKNGFPARKLRVIGVTGTNGKTTTCFLIWKMLNNAGYKTGLMTTVAWGVKKLNSELNHMTTVDSGTLNERIRKIRDAGAEFLVLEVTSHAMEQFRTLGVPIEIAVFTNLTHEHLDYHKTIENYRRAKCKLFRKARFGIVNADDKSSREFVKASKNYITYGIKNGKVRAKNVQLGVSGVEYAYGDMKIRTRIPGEFNVYNSLAAICVGEKLGLEKKEIEEGIFALENVEGRMNSIDEGQEFSVIVDYAHTPDALEKVFEAVRGAKGRVIAVHGGAGRRDETTRAERGEILGRNADVVIITEDDSRDEDPEKIARQFVRGAEKAGKTEGKDLKVELDRGEAIRLAVRLARKGDLVLILGKGHEKTILRREGAVAFEDIKVAKKCIRERLAEEASMKSEGSRKERVSMKKTDASCGRKVVKTEKKEAPEKKSVPKRKVSMKKAETAPDKAFSEEADDDELGYGNIVD